MSENVSFGYGAFNDELEKQANEQGYTFGTEAETLDKIRKAINMCGFHVATESQVKAMFDKLHKRVMKSLKPLD
jgi:hypothetical protein